LKISETPPPTLFGRSFLTILYVEPHKTSASATYIPKVRLLGGGETSQKAKQSQMFDTVSFVFRFKIWVHL